MLKYIFIFLVLAGCVKKNDIPQYSKDYTVRRPLCDLDPLFCNDGNLDIDLEDLPENEDTGAEE